MAGGGTSWWMGQKNRERPFFARIANRSNSYDTPTNSDGERFPRDSRYHVPKPKETCLSTLSPYIHHRERDIEREITGTSDSGVVIVVVMFL